MVRNGGELNKQDNDGYTKGWLDGCFDGFTKTWYGIGGMAKWIYLEALSSESDSLSLRGLLSISFTGDLSLLL